MTVIECTHADCRKSYRVSPEIVGCEVKCKKCGRTFLAATTDRESVVGQASETNLSEAVSAKPPDRSSRASSSSTKLPERIGRFVVRQKLGHGAFGNVYRAYDPQLDREVAIKVPLAGLVATPQFVERFLREAKAAARLNHPHIVPVYDAGQDGDQSYIASAFIDGEPLSEKIEEFSKDYRRIAEVIRRLADALHYAHSQKIVHRDIKPHNVMIDAADEPHLMDFGLAHLGNEAQKLTHDGTLMGTPAYMSPEQAAGKTDEVTAASDQYSLGVVLFELLTGETPFAGSPSVVVYNILNRPLPALRSLNPKIPRDLETICLKALASHPASRYATCGELAADLDRWLHDRPITARRVSLAEQTLRWCRRNPVVAGLSAAVFFIAITGFSATISALQAERRSRDLADQHAQQASDLTKDAERARDAAQDAERLALQREQELKKRESELTAQKLRLEEILSELGVTKSQLVEMEQSRDVKIANVEEEAAAARQRAEQAEKDAAMLKDKQPLNEYFHAIGVAADALSGGNRDEATTVLETTDPEQRGAEWHLLHSAANKSLVVTDTLLDLELSAFPRASNRLKSDDWALVDDVFIRWSDGKSTKLAMNAGFEMEAVSEDYKYVAMTTGGSQTRNQDGRKESKKLFVSTLSQPLFSGFASKISGRRLIAEDYINNDAGMPACAAVVSDGGAVFYLNDRMNLMHSYKNLTRAIVSRQTLFPDLVDSAKDHNAWFGLYRDQRGGVSAFAAKVHSRSQQGSVYLSQLDKGGAFKNTTSYRLPYQEQPPPRESDLILLLISADEFIQRQRLGLAAADLYLSYEGVLAERKEITRFLISGDGGYEGFPDETSGRVLWLGKSSGSAFGGFAGMIFLHVHAAPPSTQELTLVIFPIDRYLIELGRTKEFDLAGVVSARISGQGHLSVLYSVKGKRKGKGSFFYNLVLRRLDFSQSYSQR